MNEKLKESICLLCLLWYNTVHCNIRQTSSRCISLCYTFWMGPIVKQIKSKDNPCLTLHLNSWSGWRAFSWSWLIQWIWGICFVDPIHWWNPIVLVVTWWYSIFIHSVYTIMSSCSHNIGAVSAHKVKFPTFFIHLHHWSSSFHGNQVMKNWWEDSFWPYL